ncbi:ECF transporter S component [Bifidobacterium reuteri]|uniref:ECF transporter S component n=2 Tax=Bifidobacterium reuteri TaxID=983706 RepID=A0A5J5EA68_9BIFI|nr:MULTISPECIES: ECF transporter S component [Bifidobacterium]KAA8826377.1 ECF transporter S component [Bifidobacterium reuteri]KFI85800.1 putative membrane protein [Bifidobacterium reuteri DSM 23975]TPF79149.1 membrane protein [Bifidobacterium sp. UTCIF-1]TPF83183.1 membrane protein [Bifidobacterium sp. UTCIF-3]TPF93417.1 membrane protein [Bifidobacterium sp. UTBIF-68]
MSISSRIRMQVVRSVAPEAQGAGSDSGSAAGDVSNAKLGSHSTGVADSGRWSTKRIAMYALFVALAMVTSFIEFPITPVTWLKYDPSGIVCLIAGFAFGPSAAAIVSVLGFVPHLFADPWGTLMAVLVALCLSVPASFIYRANRTRKGALIGILVGAVLAIVAALLGNLVVTPIYAHMTVQAVAAMILPILLPFNVAKMAIHAVVTFLIYKPISNLLAKQQ